VFYTYLPLLLLISYIDLKCLRIPNFLNFLVLAIGIGFVINANLVIPGVWFTASVSAVAVFILGLSFAALSKGAIGGGDIKLATALSFPVGSLGYDRIMFAWTVIGFCSLIIGIALIGLRKSLKTMVPFGPCLALGYLAAMM
jgi:Flp pilus assembly protein protease CpaA